MIIKPIKLRVKKEKKKVLNFIRLYPEITKAKQNAIHKEIEIHEREKKKGYKTLKWKECKINFETNRIFFKDQNQQIETNKKLYFYLD